MRRGLTALVATIAGAFALSGAASAQDDLQLGRALYASACASCHGATGLGNPGTGPPEQGARGVPGAGPPVVGSGARAAHFYLTTGYMPLSDPYDQPTRGRPAFGDRGLRAVIAYIASFGGPPIPQPHPGRANLAAGLRLFTEHCAGCHQVVAVGGIVTDAVAPALDRSTPVQIAEAVRIGPYVMPAFPEGQLSDRELDSIIRYVQYAKNPDDRGGWALGHLGPVPEGLVAWLIAGGALIFVTLLIGARRRSEGE
jgi:ubiquinol-cytochrome c reductase cytochrome c subunit